MPGWPTAWTSWASPCLRTKPSKLTAEMAADFLGCCPEGVAIQSMAVAHTSQVLYAVCSEAINVVLPRINLELGGDLSDFARMQMGTNLLQAGGGAAFGLFADRYGPKAALLAAHSAAICSSTIFAAAHSKTFLYLGCLPLVAKHGYQAAQQVATLHSSRSSRTKALGRIGTAYGMGFLAGSVVVTRLAGSFSPRGIAACSVAMDVCTWLVVWAMYPESLHNEREDLTERESPQSPKDFGLSDLARHRYVPTLLVFKAVTTGSAGMILGMLQQFALDPFKLSLSSAGLMTSYIGIAYLVAQAVVAPALGNQSPRILVLGSFAFIGLSLGSLAFASGPLSYAALLGPLVISSHASNVAINSALTLLVSQEEQGQVLGVSMACTSVGYLWAPLLAAGIYQHLGFPAVPLVAAAILGATSAVSLLVLEYEAMPAST
ncbi:Slc22a18 [Symbiodinium sp. CCMP2456]|nr:Slc22a18 [Symbiodinium sp. CCMP2456]